MTYETVTLTKGVNLEMTLNDYERQGWSFVGVVPPHSLKGEAFKVGTIDVPPDMVPVPPTLIFHKQASGNTITLEELKRQADEAE